MPRGRTAMHWMKDVLRLHHECGRSQREIERSCGVSVGTVNGLLRKAREAGLGWPWPEDLDEQQPHQRLYGSAPGAQQHPRREELVQRQSFLPPVAGHDTAWLAAIANCLGWPGRLEWPKSPSDPPY